MIQQKELAPDTTDREIVITRLLNAPRELVYKVWTDPTHVAKWWGPNGFSNTIREMEVKPGGTWSFMMHAPDGTDFPNKIVYTEVKAPELLVYDHGSDDPNDRNAFKVRVTFADEQGKTRLTMRTLFETAEERDRVMSEFGAVEGGNQTINRLEGYMDAMRGDVELLSRSFDAPRELVFKAWTQAEHLAKWWGPKGFDLEVITLDVKPGGIFHYRMSANGQEMWGKFVFQEISAPGRLVFVSSFADKDGNVIPNPWLPIFPLEIRNVVTFAEEHGKTLLTLAGKPLNATPEQQKGYMDLRENMQQGFGGTFDKLDAHLAETQGSTAQNDAEPIEFERTYNAAPATVWRAITDKAEMKQWYFDLAEFKPEVGFTFSFYGGTEDKQWLHLCEVTEVVTEKKLTYSWRYDGQPGISYVTFELAPVGEQTLLTLTHRGLESFPPLQDFRKENFVAGWTSLIGTSLKNFLEKNQTAQ
ncbi:MAG: SRPBCC family protein [Bacteroidota bacterium]